MHLRLALAYWSKKFSVWDTLEEGISKNSEYSLSLMPEVMHLWSSAWSTWMHWHCCKSGVDLLYAWIVHICGSQSLTFDLKNWSFWCTSAQQFLWHWNSVLNANFGCLCVEKNKNIVCCRFMTVFTVILGQFLWVLDASISLQVGTDFWVSCT